MKVKSKVILLIMAGLALEALIILIEFLGKAQLPFLTFCTLGGVCFLESGFRKTTFQTFFCLFAIRKVGQHKTLFGQRKTLSSQIKFGLVPGKCFPFILGGKHFPEVVKNLEMLYYLLIISNLVLKLLIAIYILF